MRFCGRYAGAPLEQFMFIARWLTSAKSAEFLHGQESTVRSFIAPPSRLHFNRPEVNRSAATWAKAKRAVTAAHDFTRVESVIGVVSVDRASRWNEIKKPKVRSNVGPNLGPRLFGAWDPVGRSSL